MNHIAFGQCFRLLSVKNKLKPFRLMISVGFSTEQQHEINKVTIIGTVYKHLYTLPSGYKSYIVKTIEPANRFYYHMVGTGSKVEWKTGQRIRLDGRISSQNHWTEQGKLRQKIIIKCGELELIPEGSQYQQDRNQVELVAQISSDIENVRDSSSFTMTTRYTPKGGLRAGIFITEYHRILVREPSQLEIVRNQLKKGDWIHIDGRISYSFTKNNEGKLRQSGYVLAHKLDKYNNTSL